MFPKIKCLGWINVSYKTSILSTATVTSHTPVCILRNASDVLHQVTVGHLFMARLKGSIN